MTAWGWIVCCCQIWTLISIANFFVWVNCFVSSVQLCDYKNKIVRITCRPPPDAALVLKVLEKSVPPIFYAIVVRWSDFFRTCGESLPISFHSSIPLLELTLVLQITESKDSSIIFMKIGRRSKTQATGPNPLASDFSQNADHGGYKRLRAA